MKRKLVIVLLSLLCAYSVILFNYEIYLDGDLSVPERMLLILGDGPDLTHLLLFIGFYTFFNRYLFQCRLDFHMLFLSAVYSVCLLLGKSYALFSSWDRVIPDNYRQLAETLFCFLCFSLIIYILIFLLAGVYEKPAASGETIGNYRTAMISKHFFIFAFLLIIICWLPYILINLPGSVPYDGLRQLNMYLGIQNLTNHHPVFVTYLFGILFSIGRIISDKAGVFLIVIFNTAACSLIYAYLCNKIFKMTGNIRAGIAGILFYAVVPIWGAYSQAVIKDTLYFSVFALWFSFSTELYLAENNGFSMYMKYFVLCILTSLIRNNGFYIVFPVTVLLILFAKNGKKQMMILSAALLMSYMGFNKVLLPAMSIPPSPAREKLSLVFQQTARYVSIHADELSEYEIETVDHVLRYEDLAARYRTSFADPVKNGMPGDVSPEEMNSFYKVWLNWYTKHPDTLIQATINDTYGYYYPFYVCDALLSYQFYTETKNPPNTGELDIYYLKPDSTYRDNLTAYSEIWQLFPMLAMLISPGFYTWVVLFLVMELLRNHLWKDIVLLAAPALNILVCFASPVNGYLRYAMPLMAIIPLLAAVCRKEVLLRNNSSNRIPPANEAV